MTNFPYSPGTRGFWDVGSPVLKTRHLSTMPAAREATEERHKATSWEAVSLPRFTFPPLTG